MHENFLVHLKDMDEKYACNFKVMSQEVICNDVICLQPAPWIKQLEKKSIKLTNVEEGQRPVDLLIGADVAGKILTGNHHNLANGLTAIETSLGWTVIGESKECREKSDVALTVSTLFMKQNDISQLWNLDVIGITDPASRKSLTQHDADVKRRFLDTVQINKEGRYEVELPWIDDHAPLPSNEPLARKRLEQTLQKLKVKNIKDDYREVLEEWTRDGIIETVPDEELNKTGHYLPHRPVIKEDSSTRIRPVFDASAREKNMPSLNQCLEKGPNLIELMSYILLRFRKSNLGVISDIRKAFLQISIAPKDRDKLRFLWKDRGDLEVYRHCRVVFGVSSSPFILGATIQLHLERARNKEIAKDCSLDTILKLDKGFYVDNCICSVDTEDDLKKFIDEATAVMAIGGFDLRRWEHTHDGSSKASMVLGMIWNKVDDTLALNMSLLKETLPLVVTKKVILSAAHRIFDPIGVACPVLLRPKLLLQKAWDLKLDWDAEIEGVIKDNFIAWMKSLPALEGFRIPRKIGWSSDGAALSLHTFCDASGLGYAAAVCLRTQTGKEVKVQLAAAKARVAPIKELTTPRLKLLAATIAARLATSVIEALGCTDIFTAFWSDSSTVLSWIKREAQWSRFVWNRVQEIRRLTSPESWRHVPGESNPADLPSRGCSDEQLISSRWWEGPAWLKDKLSWPSIDCATDEDLVNAERKKSTVAMINCKSGDLYPNNQWHLHYFSNYLKIIRLLGWICRFTSNARCKSSKTHGNLTHAEIVNAESKLFVVLQREMFSSTKDLKLKGYEIFTDDKGIMRIKTKIVNRDDTFEFRCPVILDSRHEIVRRLIEYEHNKAQYAGVHVLMNNLREKYWIIAARRIVRSVVAGCVRCKRFSAKRLEAQPSALPVNRVRDAAVFEITGVDFAGPLFLKKGQKAWICLFTCAIYRAIHLELVSSLSTSTFIEALRRFIARRGRPSIVYSDNGTNFTGFKNAFEKLNWSTISEYSTTQAIEWRLNPPSAAWWGGWWERLVRSVKQSLRKVLEKASIDYEEMCTILCDCEALINSRPLSYVSDDPSDLIPLSPASFLHEIREIGVSDCDNIDNSDLNVRYKYRQKLKDDLRRRFRVEYLGSQKTQANMKTARSIQVDDVVLVRDDTQKRLDWALGIVTRVIPGIDGKIRVVTVKTAKTELTRPIQRIYPLEISLSDSKDEVSVMLKGIDHRKITAIKDKTADLNETECSESNTSQKTLYMTKSGRAVKSTQRFDL